MRWPLPGRRVLPLLAALCTPLLAPRAASAQDRVVVFPEPGTPVIATELLIATGPADETPERAGIAHLAARAVTAPIRAELDSLDAHLIVRAHKDALSFSLTAAPDAWAAATQMLLVALFRDPVDSAAFAQERQAVLAELRARQANPADAVVREADAAFFGEEHPWGRATVGVPETVERLTLAAADSFLRAHFTPDRTVAAVVGPADPERARAQLGAFLNQRGPLRVAAPPRGPVPEPVRRDYNSITTWVAAVFPFPAEVDEEALRLYAYLISEELAFGPTRRSVFDVRTEVLPRAGGGEMRITLVVPPGEAGAWADRIREVARDVARRPSEGWEVMLRRYRGERLQTLLSPGQRAREAARRLLVLGRSPSVVPVLAPLSAERVRAAAASLGEPTLVFLGPFLDDAR